jgi:hypothetical protein
LSSKQAGNLTALNRFDLNKNCIAFTEYNTETMKYTQTIESSRNILGDISNYPEIEKLYFTGQLNIDEQFSQSSFGEASAKTHEYIIGYDDEQVFQRFLEILPAEMINGDSE